MSEPMADELVVSKVKDALSDMQGMVSEAGFASCVRDLQEFVPRLLALVAAQAEQVADGERERRAAGVRFEKSLTGQDAKLQQALKVLREARTEVDRGFLVPEEAREQYAEYARQIAGYWPSPPPFNGRDILVAKIKAGRNERVNCAACGEIAIFEMQSEKWEHAEPNSDHEVRLWR